MNVPVQKWGKTFILCELCEPIVGSSTHRLEIQVIVADHQLELFTFNPDTEKSLALSPFT